MTEEICENCLFYIKANEDIGGCKRYPPVYKPKNSAATIGFNGTPVNAIDPREWSYPIVYGVEWCGEYKQFKKETA